MQSSIQSGTIFYLIFYSLREAHRIKEHIERILSWQLDMLDITPFDPELAQMIQDLWSDSIIHTMMDRSSEFYLMDSAP